MSRLTFDCILLWIDNATETYPHDYKEDLEYIFKKVYFVTEPDVCLTICKENESANLFVVTSGSYGKILVPQIHDLRCIDTIIIYCFKRSLYEAWSKDWKKIVGVYDNITSLVLALKHATKQFHQNSVTFDFIDISNNDSDYELDHLEPSFMYTTLLKNLILKMKHQRTKEMKIFVKKAREKYLQHASDLAILEEFAVTYQPTKAIQWYTRESFLYKTLNNALRCLRADVIVDFGFLIYDIHRNLKFHHQHQASRFGDQLFQVYRGQVVSREILEMMQARRNGLIGFNCFLSTSTNRSISLNFAVNSAKKSDLIGILFVITVDPKLDATAFASIESLSATPNEEEILFSMHSIFRIGETQAIAEISNLYEVQLTLTAENDSQLNRLTEYIEQRIKGKGWLGIAEVLIEINYLERAEEIYLGLLQNEAGNQEAVHINRQLGIIKYRQKNLSDALNYFEKALRIAESAKKADPNNLASAYNNIASVYSDKGEFFESLKFYEKAIAMMKKIAPDNNPDMAIAYNNIGAVYKNTGEYVKALQYYEKALAVLKQTLPDTHPNLANTYNNIGVLHKTQGQYSEALSYYQKTLAIQMKTLPPDHPDIAESFRNFGAAYVDMEEYEKATESYMKALHIYENGVSQPTEALKTCFQNLGFLHARRRKFDTALDYYQKALAIFEKALPETHPQFATAYNNIGSTYESMGEYSRALFYYEKALAIFEKTLPETHPKLATAYNNIGQTYESMGEYPRALSYYEKALAIFEKTLPETHPQLVTAYRNIGSAHRSMGDHSRALSYCEKALAIQKKSSSENHSYPRYVS